MILYWILRSGLWRSLDAEKIRFFLGLTPGLHLSRRYPLWRHLPIARALFSPRGSREVFRWLEYRVQLYDGQAG